MRRIGALLCAVAAAAVMAPPALARNAEVSIQGFAFQPPNVTLPVGESVVWTQRDAGTQHTVTGPDFDSGNLSAGQGFVHTFNQVGSFDYHCKIHPSMTGTVHVVDSTPPPTQSTATTPAPAPAPAPAAPAPQAAPTTVRPTTTVTTAPATTTTVTTLVPPVAADAASTSTTTAAAGGDDVALPAQQASSGDDGLNPVLVGLAIALVAAAAAAAVLLRRRMGEPSG